MDRARLIQLYERVLREPEHVREAFLAREAGSDPELLGALIAMLRDKTELPDIGEAATSDPAAPAGAVSPDLLDGQWIGSYRIISTLGRGGLGDVYLAEKKDPVLQRVAVKVMRHGLDSEELHQRFKVEQRVLAGLKHPNIASLLEAGTTKDGRSYIVMEYIDGVPIDRYCDEHELTTDQRLRLFQTVCAAVQYLHGNLIVHCDIKPGNILVDHAGNPKLLDFGIVKLLNAPLLGVEALTRTANRVMTPEFASPEQARNDPGDPITVCSDIYSLGVLLYHILTGHAPYDLAKKGWEAMVQTICESEPVRPSEAVSRPLHHTANDGSTRTVTPREIASRFRTQITTLRRTLSGDLDNIILMAMRKSPRRRYQSAEQFARDIENYLLDQRVVATPETRLYLAGKWIKRNRWPVGTAAAVVVCLTGGVLATTVEARRARQAESVARMAEQSARAAEQLAETRFFETRLVARDFIETTLGRIARLVGATPVRRIAADAGVEVLRRFEARAGEDPELSRILALALRYLGNVQAGQTGGGSGDEDDAIKSYDAAVKIGRRLRAANPDDADACMELARSAVLLGKLRRNRKDVASADTLMKEAETASAVAIRLRPLDRAAVLTRSFTLFQFADHLRFSNEPDSESIARMNQEAFSLLREFEVASPGDPDVARELALAEIKVSRDLEARQRFAEALDGYRKALRYRERIAKERTADATAKRDVALTYWSIAEVCLKLESPAQAEQAAVHSIELLGALAAEDPSDYRLKMDLLRSRISLLGAKCVQKQVDSALRDATVARAEVQALLAAKNDVAEVCYRAGELALGLAPALIRDGKRDEAKDFLSWAKSLVAEWRSDSKFKDVVSRLDRLSAEVADPSK